MTDRAPGAAGWSLWLWVCLSTLVAPLAAAHDVRPGAVALREVQPDRFAVRITRPRGPSGPPLDPRPVWPAGCALDADGLRCADGLRGGLALPGLAGAEVECLVAVEWLDGRRFDALLDGRSTEVTLDPGAPPAESSFTGWLGHGIEHILLGPDHLLFVLGLALVVRRRRALLLAITGFTLAHSLTLAAAALGLIPAAGQAVELLIAASVLLLAVEASRPPERGPPPTARHPLWVVLPFGLLHGLGFAGPLLALGLPADGALTALVGFNLGVELGQLVVLGAALSVLALAPALRRPAAWPIGVVAGWWTLDRTLRWVAHWAT